MTTGCPAMTCPTCELLASDTSHLEQVQEWEFQKAEMLNALRSLRSDLQYLCSLSTLRFDQVKKRQSYVTAEAVIRKYEVA
jgi:hypothetical protein